MDRSLPPGGLQSISAVLFLQLHLKNLLSTSAAVTGLNINRRGFRLCLSVSFVTVAQVDCVCLHVSVSHYIRPDSRNTCWHVDDDLLNICWPVIARMTCRPHTLLRPICAHCVFYGCVSALRHSRSSRLRVGCLFP